MARGLKFRIKEKEELYNSCSVHADLRLCFCVACRLKCFATCTSCHILMCIETFCVNFCHFTNLYQNIQLPLNSFPYYQDYSPIICSLDLLAIVLFVVSDILVAVLELWLRQTSSYAPLFSLEI